MVESRSKASATAAKPAAPSSGTITATSVGSSQDRADCSATAAPVEPASSVTVTAATSIR